MIINEQTNGQPRDLPTILVALSNTADARLLERVLGDDYRLRTWQSKPEDPATRLADADLLVIDTPFLHRHGAQIRELRSRTAPSVLPVLLAADSRVKSDRKLTAELGRAVDDILRIPTSRSELIARVENLLRLRRLSQTQEASRQELAALVGALHTLNACDAIVVRSKTEEELINSLCRTIAKEKDYSLAWIGFANGEAGQPINIVASAGRAKAFIHDLNRVWADQISNLGSVARTMRSRETQIVSNIADDTAIPGTRDTALAHGLATCITLYLNIGTGPPGCLAIYADTADHFGREEQQLLERLADNLAFGLNSLRLQREREHQAAEIHTLAYTDALTGLPNRRHLVEYLDEMLSRPDEGAPSGAMLFIDLDGFKLINDALGHDIGDQVLRQIAHRLESSVRDTDLVVRQGGDEFLVVLFDDPRHPKPDEPDRFVGDVHALADRIIEHLEEPMTVEGHEHRLSASIGISLYPQHGREAGTLIEHADTAMYEAKRSGGNRSHLFSEAVAVSRQERFSMESRLRRALEREQFELHYQPIFEIESGEITGAEALIRWPQEDGETLMPGAFMPIVEEIGLIDPLGLWVLETAAREVRKWTDRDLDLRAAVNLSVNQLGPRGQSERFVDLVTPYVDPGRLCLEVTESALMVDPELMQQRLTELHEAGFRLAIDDFGTGFSSLSRLQNLPVDILKIDRSFVSQLGRDNGGRPPLAPTIQQMAGNLKLDTIAEGIETDQQRQALIAIGTRYGQGFWLSPAVPSAELESLVRSSTKD